jgi:SNF2 family DNA or RNA helicase
LNQHPPLCLLCSPEQRLDRGFLEKWRWSHLIMDEAHALKNRNASRTTRLRRVSNVSRRRIMMTGAWAGGGCGAGRLAGWLRGPAVN